MRVYYHPMATMQAAAEVAGTLGDPARLAILAALLEGEATVSDLAARLDLAQPRVSTHLARLRAVGLVSRASQGRHRTYRAEASRVKPLLDALYASGDGPPHCAARAPATTAWRAWRGSTCSRPCAHAAGCAPPTAPGRDSSLIHI